MEILYKPTFIRQFGKLEKMLQEEVLEKIEMFKIVSHHKQLKVNKLKGELNKFYSFSVNYSYRIVFAYESKTKVVLLSVGDHSVYR